MFTISAKVVKEITLTDRPQADGQPHGQAVRQTVWHQIKLQVILEASRKIYNRRQENTDDDARL
ncbi:unnamed protein product [Ceratitis capitata]|uniref:(Mediterranean fruit fly) hypothetical protein n=1 Tax=Ceratitis capitata TaxID=7213 RepID=A0A811V330_CERCA|nr:unnamed protein product [Ceratitis capitata]